MRTFLNSLKKTFPILVSGMFLLILGACGTQNQKYNTTDGIYTTEDKVVVGDETQEVDKTNYYKQYFKSKTGSYDELPEEGAVFTDIEAYSTTDTLDDDGYIVTEEVTSEEGYGAWGSNSDNITVNVYNNGGYGYGGFGYGYGHNPYWSYGWGYSNYWYAPYWGFSYGWGYPYYGGYYCSPFYGGYYSPYYNHGYGYGNNIAYNRGRRNTAYLAGRSSYRNRSNQDAIGRNSYDRSEINRRADRSRPRADRPSSSRPSSATRPRADRPNSTTRPSSNSRPSAERPSPRTRPTSRPANRPTSRPANRPTSRPTSRPASRPTSRPASRPTSRPASTSRGGSRGSRSSSGRRGGRG